MSSDFNNILLPKLRDALKQMPIKKAWLFGSYSRGEQRADSDIDLLVRYDDPMKMSLFMISKISVELRHVLGKNVDLVEEGRLLPFAESSANQDKILIYERENKGQGKA